ncbi:hypothetical protein [Helicobacter cetorum]|uniref:Uncharacterized protein n=1 Tax=Helicobacter cetorum (strain ATCC BAA-540 / CCUG 52418 / MIT 99-5656) TaxID=1163745 RepID=I0ESH6_HELCM|nr:hypothetical protein [Helicobacter cetorum]AFI05895.1 hypothetical protein HCD_04405 [Helicobacter cetorum MIT 99-5656]
MHKFDYEFKKRALVKNGFLAFKKNHYSRALRLFSEALFLDTSDNKAKVGALLSDIALDFPKEAHSFYELYQSLIAMQKRSLKHQAEEQILNLIASFDEGLNKMTEAIDTQIHQKGEELNGILYADFKRLSLERGFKEAFEDLMFSTRVIFDNKEDFYQFLQELNHYGYHELAINYIENMHEGSYIHDSFLCAILEEALKHV